MACLSPSSALFPIANSSIPANETVYPEYAWEVYLTLNSSGLSTYFNASATLELARRDVESCPGWDLTCQNSSQIFANQIFLGVCTLYPNITGEASSDQQNFSRPKDPAVIPAIKSVIPTCLISYCALIPACSQSQFCTSSQFFTATGDLSSNGVGDCWSTICGTLDPHVNSDFGGIGVCGFQNDREGRLLTIAVDDLVLDANGNCVTRFRLLVRSSCARILPIEEERCAGHFYKTQLSETISRSQATDRHG